MTFDGLEPRKEYRAHFSPPTTLSSKNEGDPPSFMAADTGVSISARISLYTGTRFPFDERDLNSSKSGYNILTKHVIFH